MLSIVIPTRHRPDFVREALHHATAQRGDYEIVVADNYVNPELSVRGIVDEFGTSSIRYVRPPQPLGMVENWNFALSAARGDYVLYFTDKTFLLPGAIARLTGFLEQNQPEILNWTVDSYSPLDQSRPFSAGVYSLASAKAQGGAVEYGPREALCLKGRGETARAKMSAVDYVRGKICFGAYKRELIDRIQVKYGPLFQSISPDYTSMILALAEATSGMDVGWTASVQVHSNVSNGMQCALSDEAAKRFLDEIGALGSVMTSGLAPGVYASVSANVAFDYLTLKERFGLSFEFDRAMWLADTFVDLHAFGRTWSSPEAKSQQTSSLARAIAALPESERKRFDRRLASASKTVHPAGMVRLRGALHDWIGEFFARTGMDAVLNIIARTGVLKNFHTCSLRDAMRVASEIRP